jgi:EAL domain-containing protein (putative c-di-GMP-specific phosphodiesterase class I)
MPLEHLVDTFNARFIAENQLEAPALTFDGQSVRGRFGNLTFSSDLKPVRLHSDPDRIIGHDTAPLVFSPANSLDTTRLLYGEAMPNIVSLDRLSRTVHMLNYLILDRPEGNLFLHVHPHHVLTVKRDHGAYFEDIIRQCGLPLRRIVIGLTLNPSYETQAPLLLERLKNYRDRGYSTSLKFSEHVGSDFVERFRIQFLHRFAPDYVRFQVGFFHRAYQDHGGGRRAALLAAIRQVDTQVLIGDIRNANDLELLGELNPDYVQGLWLDDRTHHPTERKPLHPMTIKRFG